MRVVPAASGCDHPLKTVLARSLLHGVMAGIIGGAFVLTCGGHATDLLATQPDRALATILYLLVCAQSGAAVAVAVSALIPPPSPSKESSR